MSEKINLDEVSRRYELIKRLYAGPDDMRLFTDEEKALILKYDGIDLQGHFIDELTRTREALKVARAGLSFYTYGQIARDVLARIDEILEGTQDTGALEKAVLEEREACAEIAFSAAREQDKLGYVDERDLCCDIGKAIRARGEGEKK